MGCFPITKSFRKLSGWKVNGHDFLGRFIGKCPRATEYLKRLSCFPGPRNVSSRTEKPLSIFEVVSFITAIFQLGVTWDQAQFSFRFRRLATRNVCHSQAIEILIQFYTWWPPCKEGFLLLSSFILYLRFYLSGYCSLDRYGISSNKSPAGGTYLKFRLKGGALIERGLLSESR